MKVAPDDFPDGLIEMDSKWGKRIGFTSYVFTRTGEVGSQLYKRGNCMYIQAIETRRERRNQKYLSKLLDSLWAVGFTIKVPNPLPNMVRILTRKGFVWTEEQTLTSSEPDLEKVMIKAPPGRTLKIQEQERGGDRPKHCG